MTSPAPTALHGARVLVLEDEYFIAADLRDALTECGASVLGPFRRTEEVVAAIARERPSMALVDINLGLGPSFDAPRALREADIPFAFVTGYDQGAIVAEFAGVPRIEKPVAAAALCRTRSSCWGRRSPIPRLRRAR